MPSREILCENCATETAALRSAGATYISCQPIAAKPGFCSLSWSYGTRAPAPKRKAAAKPTRSKRQS